MAEHNLTKPSLLRLGKLTQFPLSLITLDLKLEVTEVKYRFSNPKRFSLLLGRGCQNQNPESFLINKARIRDFEDLQKPLLRGSGKQGILPGNPKAVFTAWWVARSARALLCRTMQQC
jgi:hypothetical protein